MNERNILEFVLLKYFSGTEDVARETAGELEKLQANGLIDAFAHELAEQTRQFVGPRQLPSGPEPEHIERYVSGWHDAANFIDPEVPNA